MKIQLHMVSALVLALGLSVAQVHGAVRIVTTTPGHADIARQVGAKHVTVESIMRGGENAHNVAARPSYMLKLRRADLFIHSGLDGEPWVSNLVKGARKRHLLPGAKGNIDVSRGVKLHEVPKRGELTRARGHIHMYGNPHYALDPKNGVVIARNIADALKRTDPAHADDYERNYKAYAKQLGDLTDKLVKKMAPYKGVQVIVYHRTWSYFLDRFALTKAGEIEPKPGIAPGPRHLSSLIRTMKERGAKVVILETYANDRIGQSVAKRGGGKVVALAQEVGAVKGVDTYEKLAAHNVDTLIAAFKQLGIKPAASVSDEGN